MQDLIAKVVQDNKGNMYRLVVIILLVANLFTTVFMGSKNLHNKTVNDVLQNLHNLKIFFDGSKNGTLP